MEEREGSHAEEWGRERKTQLDHQETFSEQWVPMNVRGEWVHVRMLVM